MGSTKGCSLSPNMFSRLKNASATSSLLGQGMLNFICYGLNDKLKQAWLQVRILPDQVIPISFDVYLLVTEMQWDVLTHKCDSSDHSGTTANGDSYYPPLHRQIHL